MTKPKILHIGMNINMPYIQEAFKAYSSEFLEIPVYGDVNQRIKDAAFTFKPDLVFMQVQSPDIIDIMAMNALRHTNPDVFIVNWTGDVRQPIPQWYFDLAPYIDYTCFTNETDVETMQAKGFKSAYIEIGIDASIFKPEGEIIQIKPIAFFGNDYSNDFPLSQMRRDMVAFMKSNFPDDFGVYGNFPGADGNFMGNQLREAAAYRSCKIAINMSHFAHKRYSSDRLLKILAMGKPICLAQWYDGINIDFEDDYINGLELETWYTFEQLADFCQYFLDTDNEDLRLEIVNRAHKKAHSQFTFHNTVENLIKLYEREKT